MKCINILVSVWFGLFIIQRLAIHCTHFNLAADVYSYIHPFVDRTLNWSPKNATPFNVWIFISVTYNSFSARFQLFIYFNGMLEVWMLRMCPNGTKTSPTKILMRKAWSSWSQAMVMLDAKWKNVHFEQRLDSVFVFIFNSNNQHFAVSVSLPSFSTLTTILHWAHAQHTTDIISCRLRLMSVCIIV